MKVCRFRREGRIAFGVIDGGDVVEYSGRPFAEWELGQKTHPLDIVTLLAPVIPSKIIAVERNYPDYVGEVSGEPVPAEPVAALLPATTLTGPGEAVRLPEGVGSATCGTQLAVVIGSVARNVRAEDASVVIFGYTIANPFATAAQGGGQRSLASRGRDSFCPMGPWVATELDPTALDLRCGAGHSTFIEGSTTEMIFSVSYLVAYLSALMTLLPGDVILTGTPAGGLEAPAGSLVEAEIEAIGTLANPVRCDDLSPAAEPEGVA